MPAELHERDPGEHATQVGRVGDGTAAAWGNDGKEERDSGVNPEQDVRAHRQDEIPAHLGIGQEPGKNGKHSRDTCRGAINKEAEMRREKGHQHALQDSTHDAASEIGQKEATPPDDGFDEPAKEPETEQIADQMEYATVQELKSEELPQISPREAFGGQGEPPLDSCLKIDIIDALNGKDDHQ